MENLDRLTRAGLSYFDSNTEVLDGMDWSKTEIGERSKWPQTLHAYVNFISTLPHPAAIFWGASLCMIHNITWATCLPEPSLQGKHAKDCFKGGEGLASLETSLSGHTVQVGMSAVLRVPRRRIPSTDARQLMVFCCSRMPTTQKMPRCYFARCWTATATDKASWHSYCTVHRLSRDLWT